MSCAKVHVQTLEDRKQGCLPVLTTVAPWEAGEMSPEAIGEVLK